MLLLRPTRVRGNHTECALRKLPLRSGAGHLVQPAGKSSQGRTDVSLQARLLPDGVSHAMMELVRTNAENENVVGNLEFERSRCGPLLKRLGTPGNVEEARGGSRPVKGDTNG